MPKNLKTQWKRIGRSGATVDGRFIEPDWLREAAEHYNKDLFTALIWPEHERWFNMGTIEALRVEENDEAGVDLFAEIAPNDYYLQANKAGQKLFTSMELRPDFRGTGKHYLTGCAATDNPASAATSEIRFSQSKDNDLLLAQHIEATTHDFDDQADTERGLLVRLLSSLSKSSEDDMNKKALNELKTQVDAMAIQFSQILAGEEPAGGEAAAAIAGSDTDTDTGDQNFAALKTQMDEMRAELDSLKNHSADDQAENTVSLEKFNELKTAFESLQKNFNEALQEQPGTDAGDHVSDGENLADYI